MKSLHTILDQMRALYEKHQNMLISESGTMNIIDIMNISHLENKNSDVLAYLLNPKERHHHPECSNIYIESRSS